MVHIVGFYRGQHLDEDDEVHTLTADDIRHMPFLADDRSERKASKGGPRMDVNLDEEELMPIYAAAGYYFMQNHDPKLMKDFIEMLAERFLGRQVGHADEMKSKHLGDGPRTSFEINAPVFMMGPGLLEILNHADTKSMETAFCQDSRGDPTEPTFTDFEGQRVLTHGIWSTSIKGTPVCIQVWEGNGDVEFTFYYAKATHDAIMPHLLAIKAAIDSCGWFKGRSLSFTGGELSIVAPPSTRMTDVVLNETLREDIRNNSVYYLQNLEVLKQNGLYARRGILLSGPPGNGKTMLCRAINGEAPTGTTTIWVTGSSIDHTRHITMLFRIARLLAPSILIFEDIDTLAGNRQMTGRTYPLLGEMLTQMDGIGETKGVVVVATTNYPEMVDSALKDRPRRFDRHFQIPLPDDRGRVELLRRSLPSRDHIAEDDLLTLSRMMGKASAAIVEEVVHTARVDAIRKAETLNINHMVAALREVKRHEELLTSSPTVI